MKRNIVALVVGLIFGLGLCLSGMSDPSKVLGFLDLAGAWDPSLAFVMAGAIVIAAPAFALARGGRADISGARIELPPRGAIDAPLLTGAAVFGVGWGLSGICPGPGVVDVGFLSYGAALFVAAFYVGVIVLRALGSPARSPKPATQDA